MGKEMARHAISLIRKIQPEHLFYVGFFCLLEFSYINRVNCDTILIWDKTKVISVLQIICLMSFALKFFFERYKLGTVLKAIVLVAIAAGMAMISRSYTLFWLTLAIVAADGADVKHTSVVVLTASLIVAVPTLLGVSFGFVENIELARNVDGGGVRNSVGFSHPNQFGFMVFTALASYICIRIEKISAFDYAIVILSAFLIAVIADSRTTTISILLLLVVMALYQIIKRTQRGLYVRCAVISCTVIFLICAIGSVILTLFYTNDSDFLFQISKLLSGRPYYMNHYYEISSLTLFGFDFTGSELIVKEGVNTTLLLDNAYAMLLLRHGMVAFLIFCSALLLTFFRYYQDNSSCLIPMILTLFCIIGISENALIDISINYFLIVFSGFLYKRNWITFGQLSRGGE